MNIDANLAASIACDLTVPQGYGMFLEDGTSETNILQGNVRHIYNTCREYVELGNQDISHVLAQGFISVADGRSTHFVVAANYGLQSIITMKYNLRDPRNKANVEPVFTHDVRTVHDIAKLLSSLNFSNNTVNRRLALAYEFRLYTDIQKEYGICIESLALLCTFVQTGPRQIRADSGKKGYPINYTLLPLQFLRLGATTVPDSNRTHISITDIDPVLDIFDRYNEDKDTLDNYKLDIRGKKHCIPLQHFDDVNNTILRMLGIQNNLKVELKRRVLNVRNGIENDRRLHELHAIIETNPERISLVSITMQQSDKMDFITRAVGHGATYIGFNGLSLKDVTLPHDSPAPYTFEFNNAVLKSSISWKEQHDAFMKFLWNPQRRCQVYIVDCDAPLQHKHLDCARFSEMQRNNTASIQHEEQD
ncbi:hypothetical protein FVEN_g193 [Fusarium venenatum]|nr:hypothetical protein FVEN_g193 [Fusarium venenatum]